LCLSLLAFKPKSGDKSYEDLRPHMRAVYQSLMNIFPFAVSRDALLDKKNEKLIQDNLKLIADHSQRIDAVVSKDEKGHAFFSQQLQRNAALASKRFAGGHPEQAQFYIEEMYDTCLSCHTSRGATADSAFTMDFPKDIKPESLGPLGKARFLALSRQFEKAMEEYERLFSSGELSLEDLLHYDPFVDYMLLSLRVKDDRARVLKTFSQLKLEAYPVMIRHDIEAWTEALKKLKPKAPKQSELDYAKQLIKIAQSVSEYPRDRSGLVYFIYASRTLRAYLEKSDITKPVRAESYYELGVCELGIGVPYLPTESGMYFEESIRLAPKARFAKKAFALYEEGLLFGYSGSSGIHLPEEEKAKLDELRKLVY
jgi:hypothetical protein